MGLLSILLSALAVVCAGVGVLTTPIPKIGLIFAFGAPALAIAGIMVGGSAMSRAKREGGQSSETGKLGAILSAIAFVPSLLVALTCGVCNAFFSSGNFKVDKHFRVGSPYADDAGAQALPPPQRLPVAGGQAPQVNPPDAKQAPDAKPTAPPTGPTSLPPPPLPPGPGK
ncbi:MAG TPA: hypothetical protein VJV78_15665 [Polyangiales bacterium]|nr:hypothetical protein [Polyangiales bacterium]